MINIFNIMTGAVSRMSHVNRYSSFPVNRRENVAEHSWMVAFIAFVISTDLRADGYDVDVPLVLKRALFHDLDECISGDIIRNFKYSSVELHDAIAAASAENIRGLTVKIGGMPGLSLLNLWSDAKKEGLEGDIVRFSDMAAASFYMREEDRTGNRTIRPVLKEMYETWFHEFHSHEQLGKYLDQMYPEGRFFDMLREESLPARSMFQTPLWHDEGPTSDHDFSDEGDVPLG